MGEPALLLEVVVAPFAQLGQGVLDEESRAAAAAGHLPHRGLRTVLAELRRMVVGGLGPGARHAGEALRLVLLAQRLEHRRRAELARVDPRHAPDRAPTAGGAFVVYGVVVLGHSTLRGSFSWQRVADRGVAGFIRRGGPRLRLRGVALRPSDGARMAPFDSSRLKEGLPDPLGATWDGEGTNFALFSAHATKVEICLFDK